MKVTHAPSQFNGVTAEFRLAVEVGPGLDGVSATEHDWHYLLKIVKVGELSVRKDGHLHYIRWHVVVLRIFELDEVDGQPQIIACISYFHVHVCYSIEIGFRDECDFKHFSSLAFGLYLIDLFLYIDVKVLVLILVVDGDSFDC